MTGRALTRLDVVAPQHLNSDAGAALQQEIERCAAARPDVIVVDLRATRGWTPTGTFGLYHAQ